MQNNSMFSRLLDVDVSGKEKEAYVESAPLHNCSLKSDNSDLKKAMRGKHFNMTHLNWPLKLFQLILGLYQGLILLLIFNYMTNCKQTWHKQ